MNLNNVVIGGTLCSDPEQRQTTGGTSVTTFTLAQNEKWTDQNTGQKKEKASFFDVIFWGSKGNTIAKWFRKGGQIVVIGKLKQDQWQDKETGAKRSKVVVQGFNFEFCNRNSPEGDAPPKQAMATAGAALSEAGDNLPF